jgi:hypothetical protein
MIAPAIASSICGRTAISSAVAVFASSTPSAKATNDITDSRMAQAIRGIGDGLFIR